MCTVTMAKHCFSTFSVLQRSFSTKISTWFVQFFWYNDWWCYKDCNTFHWQRLLIKKFRSIKVKVKYILLLRQAFQQWFQLQLFSLEIFDTSAIDFNQSYIVSLKFLKLLCKVMIGSVEFVIYLHATIAHSYSRLCEEFSDSFFVFMPKLAFM